MSSHRYHRVTRASARRLLDGGAGSPADPLARLLAAAAASAAPGPDGELPGEQAAMSAFRAARLVGPSVVPIRRTTVVKMLSVKTAAIAAVVAASGIAVAAGTGVVPNPLSPRTRTSAHPTGNPRVSSASPTKAGATTTPPGVSPSPSATHPTPDGSPSPSLVGQCQSWTNLAAKDRGKALDTPAFAALVAAAGSRDNVQSFCAALLPPTPKPSHTTKPHPSHPGGSPNPHSSR